MFGVLPLLLLPPPLLLDWLFDGALLFELGLLLVAVELLLLVGRFIPGTVAVDRGTDTTKLGVCGWFCCCCCCCCSCCCCCC